MKKNQNNIDPEERKGVPHPESTSNREHTDVKKIINQGVPNSGGQYANQTDNKQSSVNRGNQLSGKKGKEK